MTMTLTHKTRAATNHGPTPNQRLSLRAQLPDGHGPTDTHRPDAVGTTLASDQTSIDAQSACAAGNPSPQSDGGGQLCDDTPGPPAAPDDWGYVHLTFMARVLDDIEGQRKTTDNRLRILTAAEPDSDGVVRGFNLDTDHPAVAALAAYADALKASEKQTTRELERSMKAHPLGPWVMEQKGVGLKQAARLLAAVGDPYWNTLHDRPRTVSELWAYCGYKPGQKRQKGQRANWSNDAKMRAWNVVQSIIKAGGPWRDLWDERRAVTEGQFHTSECVRCGPAGKPAQPGSPKSLGHLKADADRYVAKRLLREMWRESKRLHELAEGHGSVDSHESFALGATSPDGQRARDTHHRFAVGTKPEWMVK
jgi:hypothetical protein